MKPTSLGESIGVHSLKRRFRLESHSEKIARRRVSSPILSKPSENGSHDFHITLHELNNCLLEFERIYQWTSKDANRLGTLCQFRFRCAEFGIVGERALAALESCCLGGGIIKNTSHSERDRWYAFAFVVCRDGEKRHLNVHRAIRLWNLFLSEQLWLLPRFIGFLEKTQVQVISEDVWGQVLEFSRLAIDDLRQYNENDAWPVLLDDFVRSLRSDTSSIPSHILNGMTRLKIHVEQKRSPCSAEMLRHQSNDVMGVDEQYPAGESRENEKYVQNDSRNDLIGQISRLKMRT